MLRTLAGAEGWANALVPLPSIVKESLTAHHQPGTDSTPKSEARFLLNAHHVHAAAKPKILNCTVTNQGLSVLSRDLGLPPGSVSN